VALPATTGTLMPSTLTEAFRGSISSGKIWIRRGGEGDELSREAIGLALLAAVATGCGAGTPTEGARIVHASAAAMAPAPAMTP